MKQDLCIKAKNDFFSTTYYNICDGTEKIVNNGVLDIVDDAYMVTLFVVTIAMLSALVRFLWRNA